MIIDRANIDGLYKGFVASFNKGLGAAPSHYRDIAMTVPSETRENVYPWLGKLPRMREWIGDRVIQNLSRHGFAIANKYFEATLEVPAKVIKDDQYGVYGPLIQEMGLAAATHTDELVFGLLARGFSTPCYDGQYFFDIDHPVTGPYGETIISVSNMQSGVSPAWYLFDTSRAVRPLIWQEREPNVLTALTDPDDDNVFWKNSYVYGVHSRGNAGYGLWQLAFGSKAPLNFANYAAARGAMRALKGFNGLPLGINPDTLVTPVELEAEALEIVASDKLASGAINVYKGTAKLITTPWLPGV